MARRRRRSRESVQLHGLSNAKQGSDGPDAHAESMSIKKTTIAAFILLIWGVGVAEEKSFDASTQLHFSAEEAGVEKPTPIPAEVLAILVRDNTVRLALEDESLSSERIPPSWFSASGIHLHHHNQVDLIVLAEGPLRGANVTTFWVFCATDRGYVLALAASAHDLTLKNSRSHGYRDLEIASMTAVQISTVLFRFNGERYAEYAAKSQAIR